MTNSKDSSPAEKKYQIIERMRLDEIVLAIGEDRKFSIKREYTYQGKTGMSDWFRLKDIPDVKVLLDRYEAWLQANPSKSIAGDTATKKNKASS